MHRGSILLICGGAFHDKNIRYRNQKDVEYINPGNSEDLLR